MLLKSIGLHLPFPLRFVSRYASHLYRDAFAEVLGSGVNWTAPKIPFSDGRTFPPVGASDSSSSIPPSGWEAESRDGSPPSFGSGQEVCFCPSRPDPVRNAREQDGTRTGRDGPHLGTWMGPKHCKTKHMANLDGTTSDPGWDLDGPRIGPRRGSGWHPPETVTDF